MTEIGRGFAVIWKANMRLQAANSELLSIQIFPKSCKTNEKWQLGPDEAIFERKVYHSPLKLG